MDDTLPGIVLCGTRHPGNIGSVSRAMANFGFERLFLVDPPQGWRRHDALLHMANGYTDALDGAVVADTLEALEHRFSGLVGWTRRAGAQRPIRGDLHDAVEDLCRTRLPGGFALVFGNERTGLLKKELERCDSLYTIAGAESSGSLNLSLAAGLVMYQFSHRVGAIAAHADGSDQPPIEVVSIPEATRLTTEILDSLSITRAFGPGKGERADAENYLRRILMRARLSPFESDWLHRMSRRLRPYLRTEPRPRSG